MQPLLADEDRECVAVSRWCRRRGEAENGGRGKGDCDAVWDEWDARAVGGMVVLLVFRSAFVEGGDGIREGVLRNPESVVIAMR